MVWADSTSDGKEVKHKYPFENIEDADKIGAELIPQIAAAYNQSNSYLALKYPVVFYKATHIVEILVS